MSFVDDQLRKVFHIAGVPLPERKKINFVSGVTGVDNPETKATDLTVTSPGGGDATVADDVEKHGGSDINRIKGLNRKPFVTRDGAAIADQIATLVGGAWTFNQVNGVDGYRPKKPVMPGHFDVEDYGAIPDWGCGRTGNATNGSAVVAGVNFTTGLRVGQKIKIQDVPGVHVIQSMTSSTITLTAPVGATSGGAWIVTANRDAFKATLAAAKAFEALSVVNRMAKIISDGAYFIEDTLHVRTSVSWQGTGAVSFATLMNVQDGRSYPGTMLVFPGDCDGVWAHSNQSADVGSGDDAAGDGADESYFGHLNIACCESSSTSGVGFRFTTRVFCEHVRVSYFGGNGIQGYGYANANEGNCSGFHLFKCIATYNKGHGFRIYGGDANIGTIDSCEAGVNTGIGFYDGSGLGNVYKGCHGESNLGDVDSDATHPGYSTGGPGGTGDGLNHDFRTDAPTNCSTFISCYSETSRNLVASPATIVGGFGLSEMGGNYLDLGAFSLGPQGIFSGKPLQFRSSYPGTKGIRANLGGVWVGAADYDNVTAFSISPIDAAGADQSITQLTLDSNWWYLGTGSPYQRHFRIPTTLASNRGWGLLFEHGLMFGSTATHSIYNEASAVPAVHLSGAPIDYEVGDFVRNTDNATNPHIFGWRCTVAGQVGGGAEFEEIASGSPRTIATTDATPTTRTIATLAANDVKQVDVVVTARDATAAVRQSFKLSALYYGAAGPTATIDGSVDSTAKGTGTAAATLIASGADVELEVTGIVATDLIWSYDVSVL